jgi:hypothetical protein
MFPIITAAWTFIVWRNRVVNYHRLQSIGALRDSRIAIEVDELRPRCASRPEPLQLTLLDFAYRFQPRVSPAISIGIARRAGVRSETRPSAFQYHDPTRRSPRIRFRYRQPVSTVEPRFG